jgi:hypothetical protein
MIKMAKVEYSTKSLSEEIGTTPKELRKFLRSDMSGIESVGKGGRYTIGLTATQLGKMKKSFAKWGEELEAKRAANAQPLTEQTEIDALAMIDGENDAPIENDEEIGDDADEPTDADLNMIDEEIELDEDEIEA